MRWHNRILAWAVAFSVILGLLIGQPAHRARGQFWIGQVSSTACASNATITITTGSNIGAAPAHFMATTVPQVQAFYQCLICLPITINMSVDWNEYCGTTPLPGGTDGSNMRTAFGTVTYAQLRAALATNAISARAQSALATLPMSDPLASFSGIGYFLSQAQAKALGFTSGTSQDGCTGFTSDDPSVVAHEFSEVMGRNFDIETGPYLPSLDLYRYSGSSTRAISNATNTYFSIDSGATDLNDFNGSTNAGDAWDWRRTMAADAFDYAEAGAPVSTTDMTLIDVLGYNTNTTVTWP